MEKESAYACKPVLQTNRTIKVKLPAPKDIDELGVFLKKFEEIDKLHPDWDIEVELGD